MAKPPSMRGNIRQRALAVARGDTPSDILLKNAQVLDLVNGTIIHTHIALSGQFIAGVHPDYTKAKRIIDLEGLFVAPGFI
ncbi:MAG: adenine deaminase, partial [Alphaproteobacteria bacterium]|nr:adenine deaminase [Alphaproteobacteria bacterium]MBX9977190.1 adenine deaminase [Alphaproteobacteria bacterium]